MTRALDRGGSGGSSGTTVSAGRSKWRRLFVALVLAMGVGALSVGMVSKTVWGAGDHRVFDNLNDLRATRVGLVLGCPPRVVNGSPNLYFQQRMRAASRLFRSGKVEYLLLSGDNNKRSYNEPQAMFEELSRLGVPEDRMVRDYAGFRTLDSIVRAKEVFGQEEVIVVSQEFHNRRALYLAGHQGLGATGYNAADVARSFVARLRWRETAARVKAFADVHVLRTPAKFLGEPVPIG